MDSDSLNQGYSFVEEDQVFGGNQSKNEQLQHDSVIYSNDSNDFNEENDEDQSVAVKNNLQNFDSRSNESSRAQEDDENGGADGNSDENTDNNFSENSENNTDNNADGNADENSGGNQDDEDEGVVVPVRNAPIVRQKQQMPNFTQQSVHRSAQQFVPLIRMPQTRTPQQNFVSSYGNYQDGYEADSELYDESELNPATNPMINSKNSQVSVSNARKQSFAAYEGNNRRRVVSPQQTKSKVSNHHDISKFLNSNHGEITINEVSREPRYLNEFDQFAGSQSQDSAAPKGNKIPVVQVRKRPDDEPIQMVPDSSDGKLHINHF